MALSSNRDSILRGIEAYRHEQEVFLRLLRKKGSFTEKEFDRWFIGREFRRPAKARPITRDTLILGIAKNGGSLWAEMLDLLIIMVRLGTVRTKINSEGLITYDSGKAWSA